MSEATRRMHLVGRENEKEETCTACNGTGYEKEACHTCGQPLLCVECGGSGYFLVQENETEERGELTVFIRCSRSLTVGIFQGEKLIDWGYVDKTDNGVPGYIVPLIQQHKPTKIRFLYRFIYKTADTYPDVADKYFWKLLADMCKDNRIEFEKEILQRNMRGLVREEIELGKAEAAIMPGKTQEAE